MSFVFQRKTATTKRVTVLGSSDLGDVGLHVCQNNANLRCLSESLEKMHVH